MLFIFILLAAAFSGSSAIIGFDCVGSNINITTLSLLSAGDCEISPRTLNTTSTYIQLLQVAEYNNIEIIQCHITIKRMVYRCGMHSHISAIHNGFAEFIYEVSEKQCQLMHLSGIMTINNNNVISGLKVNSTTSRPLTLAGSIATDGSCEGTQYSDFYGSWPSVVVQATIEVTLRSGYVPVKTTAGTITLKSGTTCRLADSSCLDLENGFTFWNPMPLSSACDFSNYDVLFEGLARKTRDLGDINGQEVYSLVTDDITFALARTVEIHICGYKVFRTEHPKLFILETQPGFALVKRQSLSMENLDIFTYVNSKFVFVEKHIRTQMTTLYNDVIQQKCELERQVLANALSIAALDPAEFAYTIMKGPGYMADPAGEVIRIIKCIPTEVTIRETTKCYNELPVTFRNTSAFITPKSHILKKIGTERECSSVFPVEFFTEHGWIRLLPKSLDAQTPEQLRPQTRLSWEYLTPGKLATSGIYTQADIDKLKEHLMFPAEKPSITNNIVRGFTGKQALENGISLSNLLDENVLQEIAESTAHRVWSGFINFGTLSAGLFGLWTIWVIIKTIFSTIIHGYTLHSVFGCGFHLLGAIWSATTNLLLHLERKKQDNTPQPDPEAPPHPDKQQHHQPVTMQPNTNIQTTNSSFVSPTFISPTYATLNDKLDKICSNSF